MSLKIKTRHKLEAITELCAVFNDKNNKQQKIWSRQVSWNFMSPFSSINKTNKNWLNFFNHYFLLLIIILTLIWEHSQIRWFISNLIILRKIESELCNFLMNHSFVTLFILYSSELINFTFQGNFATQPRISCS